MSFERYRDAKLLKPISSYDTESWKGRVFYIDSQPFVEDDSKTPLFEKLDLFTDVENLHETNLLLRGSDEYDPKSAILRNIAVITKMETEDKEAKKSNKFPDLELGIIAVGEEVEVVRDEEGYVVDELLPLRGILMYQFIERELNEDGELEFDVFTDVRVFHDSESKDFKEASKQMLEG